MQALSDVAFFASLAHQEEGNLMSDIWWRDVTGVVRLQHGKLSLFTKFVLLLQQNHNAGFRASVQKKTWPDPYGFNVALKRAELHSSGSLAGGKEELRRDCVFHQTKPTPKIQPKETTEDPTKDPKSQNQTSKGTKKQGPHSKTTTKRKHNKIRKHRASQTKSQALHWNNAAAPKQCPNLFLSVQSCERHANRQRAGKIEKAKGMFGSFRMTGSSSNYVLRWLAAWRSAEKAGGSFKENETCIVLDVTKPCLTEHVNMHDQSY